MDDLHALALEDLVECGHELRVPIAKQELDPQSVWRNHASVNSIRRPRCTRLASYEVAGRLHVATDPTEHTARRWLADRAGVIVVADQDQEERVREAVARVLRSQPELASAPQAEPLGPAPTDLAEAQLPSVSPAADEYSQHLAALPPRSTRPDEPRIVHATPAYEERVAKRAALGIGSARREIVEPDVEPRA